MKKKAEAGSGKREAGSLEGIEQLYLLDRCKVHSPNKSVSVSVSVSVLASKQKWETIDRIRENGMENGEWRMENGESVLLPCSSKEESLEFGVWSLER